LIWGKRKRYGFGGKGNRKMYDLVEKRIGGKGKGTLLAETGHAQIFTLNYTTVGGPYVLRNLI